MSKNFYEEGFPDDDPTDELPVLTDVIDDVGDEDTAAFAGPTRDDEDTGTFAALDPNQIPTLAESDEASTELARGIADRDAKLASLEDELAAVRAELEKRAGEAASQRTALEAARREIGERDAEIAELTSALEAARAVSAALEQRIASPDSAHAQSLGLVGRCEGLRRFLRDFRRFRVGGRRRFGLERGRVLRTEFERAVALQANAGPDATRLRRLEELELAIRELENDVDAASAAPRRPTAEPIPAQLICLTGEELDVYALEDSDVVIGRGSHCDIRISTHYVSREHARIETIQGQCFIEDLGSRNGVFVNSVRIERQSLSEDDLVTIGDTQFRFRAAGRARA